MPQFAEVSLGLPHVACTPKILTDIATNVPTASAWPHRAEDRGTDPGKGIDFRIGGNHAFYTYSSRANVGSTRAILGVAL